MPTFACSQVGPLEIDAEVIAVPAYKGPELGPGAEIIDGALDQRLSKFLGGAAFKGEKGETLVFPGGDGIKAQLVLVVGLGEREKVSLQTLREGGAALARKSKKAASVATTLAKAGPSGVDLGDAVQAIVEGVSLGGYEFLKYKKEPEPSKLDSVMFADSDSYDDAIARGVAVASAVNWARDIVNEPAGAKSPHEIGELIKSLADSSGIECEVWDTRRLAKERLGGVFGVAAGSANEPRMVKLEYKPANSDGRTVCLVGKGVVFDSGGLSLKPAEGMETMKTDMSGAAAVAAAMSALKALAVETHVIGFMPFVENMPGGKATKPGDVLTFRNGKTAEVLNTDAEGRLILADALSLASEEKPDAIVDLATLTGACMVALGNKIFGVMGNDQELADAIVKSAERAGERGWRLPLPPDYRKQLDSEIADMKNIGNRYGGALTAGLFLKEFVDDGTPWAHLDIAGPARSEADEFELPKGGTGVGVRTLLAWLSGNPPSGGG